MATSTYLRAACAAAVLATFSSVAAAKTCQLAIDGTDQMTFDKKELAVAADCTEVQLTLKHTGKMPVTAMGHNWVLTETKD
ncbi:MAG: plastocyanin/azurin family copper-binding protein, partial [Steroidobacteraceae bacterium]